MQSSPEGDRGAAILIKRQIADLTVGLIGDPHLGKPFVNGVPLGRRGDREAMQWADFEAAMLAEDVDLIICVGDLFDRSVVSNAVVKRAADIVNRALRPVTIIAGNHDLSRDKGIVSSFQLFSEMVEPGVVAFDPCFADGPEDRGGLIALIPWHPFKSAAQLIDEAAAGRLLENADAVLGHWDVVAVHETANLIPLAQLAAAGVKLAITGHDHLGREYDDQGVHVVVTGSMQPYSHAEDPDERFYVTRTAAEARADPDAFKDKCLRVLLEPGEVFDLTIDCLAFQTKRLDEAMEEDLAAVGFEAFDMQALFTQAFAEVPSEIGELVKARFMETAE